MSLGKYFGDYARYGSMGISWVLLTLAFLYVGYRGGSWLDGRLGLYPVCTVLGVVAGVVLSVVLLIKQVVELERPPGGGKTGRNAP